jgi:probable HAF family extracellular repeat protein
MARRLGLLAPLLILALQVRPALAQEFEALGDLPGDFVHSFPYGVSADGSTVVGYSYSTNGAEAFRWTAGGGMVGLGDLPGGSFESTAFDANADGSVVVGYGRSGSGYEAFRWTAGGGMVGLGDFAGGTFESQALGVSSDGSVVVGYGRTVAGSEAFRWTQGGGMVGLGNLGGAGGSLAYGVSADGSVVVGYGHSASGLEAFRWTQGGGMVGLGDLAGGSFQSVARGVSADGSTVVGYGVSTGTEAFRWTQGGGMVGLGDLPGGSFFSMADSVSADGSVVVGVSSSATGDQAFRWTQADGMQSIRALLVAAGVDMTGWQLREALGVSASGNTIVGYGINASFNAEAWIARFGPDGAGLTTPGAQQASVNALADDRTGMMAQQHGLANPLLGGDKPLTNDSEVGVFGMGGSAAGGGFARYANSGGLAVLAGVSYGEEAYQDASIEDSLMGALAVRYLDPGKGLWRPLVEVGGWYAPDADMEFERTYMNGAGTTTGVGSTHGDVSYLYARAGLVFDLGKREQVVIAGEVGRERLEVDGYSETLSGNAFNAVVAPGTDRMDLAKARLAWSFGIAPRMDATLWGAGVYGFNRETELLAAVAGVGLFAPVIEDETAWAEYGARIGYAVTETVTFDVFVNGVSGEDDIGTRVHGGGGLRYRF